jgi:hypothetical protein
MRLLIFALGLVAWQCAPGRPADAAASSFVYCLHHAGAQIFAGKVLADRNLKFGLSIWSDNGHNVTVFGVAVRHGEGWEYTDNLDASSAADRCRLSNSAGAESTLRIAADSAAPCANRGGENTEVGTVLFPAAAYEGSVTTQLDDAESFQKAGKCAGGQG